jgi:hypothetical protein
MMNARGRKPACTARDVLRSPGRALDGSARSFLEPRFPSGISPVPAAARNGDGLAVSTPGDRFEREADRIAASVMNAAPPSAAPGFDFGNVRIHDNAEAAGAAEALNARAYTAGHHIVFGAGQYEPHSEGGRRLLAHELTHVVQQNQSQHAAPIQRTDWGPLGGKCCNESGGREWGLVGDGSWESIPSGCTGSMADCDGMTCGGGFYWVGNLSGGICKTPRHDDATFQNRRWTPTKAGSEARSPTYRGSHEGDTPPEYTYDAE